VVVLLFAALTACSDGLSADVDNPLTDRDWNVHGTVTLEGTPHTAEVGLRHVYTDPHSNYIRETTAEQNGYYSIDLSGLDSGWYACDAWYETATHRWEGSSTQFYWSGGQSFQRDIDMEQVY
jgi:hypothetical protein